jgi:hypothetical protein
MDRWEVGVASSHRETQSQTHTKQTHNPEERVGREGCWFGPAVGRRWMIAWGRVRANDPHLPAASTRGYLSIAPLEPREERDGQRPNIIRWRLLAAEKTHPSQPSIPPSLPPWIHKADAPGQTVRLRRSIYSQHNHSRATPRQKVSIRHLILTPNDFESSPALFHSHTVPPPN